MSWQLFYWTVYRLFFPLQIGFYFFLTLFSHFSLLNYLPYLLRGFTLLDILILQVLSRPSSSHSNRWRVKWTWISNDFIERESFLYNTNPHWQADRSNSLMELILVCIENPLMRGSIWLTCHSFPFHFTSHTFIQSFSVSIEQLKRDFVCTSKLSNKFLFSYHYHYLLVRLHSIPVNYDYLSLLIFIHFSLLDSWD